MATVTRTLKMYYRLGESDKKTLLDVCHYSKNLYNEAMYTIKRSYDEQLAEDREFARSVAYLGIAPSVKTHRMNYYDIDALLKQSPNYKILGSACAQETLRLVDKAWKSFYGLLNSKKKGNLGYKHVSEPGYLPKEGYYPVYFNYTRFGFNGRKGSYKAVPKRQKTITLSISKQYASLRGLEDCSVTFRLPPYLGDKRIKLVRVIPEYDGRKLRIEYVYEVGQKHPDLSAGEFMAIDLGLNNMATYVTTTGKCCIIDGRYVKSVNQHYNKENARLKMINTKNHHDKRLMRSTDRMARLAHERRMIIDNAMSKMAKHIVDLCIADSIGTVVVGMMEMSKNSINLGTRCNQNFVQVPYTLLRGKLASKCELYNIKYVEVGEEHTSLADALALEPLSGKHEYTNRRIHRGLYQSSKGLINADVNAAMNIMRKVAGDSAIMRIAGSGCWSQPERIRLST